MGGKRWQMNLLNKTSIFWSTHYGSKMTEVRQVIYGKTLKDMYIKLVQNPQQSRIYYSSTICLCKANNVVGWKKLI